MAAVYLYIIVVDRILHTRPYPALPDTKSTEAGQRTFPMLSSSAVECHRGDHKFLHTMTACVYI